MKFKRGVPLDLSEHGWKLAHLIDKAHLRATGREAVITSTTDGKHRVERSAHYRRDAVDVRIWYLPDPKKFTANLKRGLGPDYVVILEKDHIHAHYAPVYSGPETIKA